MRAKCLLHALLKLTRRQIQLIHRQIINNGVDRVDKCRAHHTQHRMHLDTRISTRTKSQPVLKHLFSTFGLYTPTSPLRPQHGQFRLHTDYTQIQQISHRNGMRPTPQFASDRCRKVSTSHFVIVAHLYDIATVRMLSRSNNFGYITYVYR